MKAVKEKKWVKWEVLLLLWMAYLLNQADRQVFNTVLPAIKASLNLTDTSVGLIATVFNLFYACLVPVGGFVGDRYSRKWVTTLSILFWSVATMFTGLANGMFLLIVMRSMATGGGEAMFGPANYSLLGQYHTDTRARAMSIHQTAYYVGVIMAGWLAGLIADRMGWRSSFLIFGVVGVIWAVIMMFRLKDKPLTTEEKNALMAKKPGIMDGFKVVFTTPTALMLTIGFSGLIFVITGFMTWIPAYLQEELHQTQEAAGFNSMFYTYVAAFVGVLIAGSLSDCFGSVKHKIRMDLQGWGLIIGALFLFFMGGSQLYILYACFAGWGFFRAFFDANTYAVLYDVTPARLHASCSSAMIMTGFAVGSFAPIVLGVIKQSVGTLEATFPILGIIWVVCGVMMLIVSHIYYQRDYLKMLEG
ncbi:MAG: MFS transporter [Alistipes sp.]|nr:MFS transporter [Candidatus Alistipes equi]